MAPPMLNRDMTLAVWDVKGDVKIQELPTASNFCDSWPRGIINLPLGHMINHLEYHFLSNLLIMCLHSALLAGIITSRGT